VTAATAAGGPATRSAAAARRPLAIVLAALSAAGAAWALSARLSPKGLPAGVVLLGVVMGSITALSAMGLVLVHRAAGIVNFAQAALGSAAATLAFELSTVRGWSYLPAVAVALVFAAGLGAALDRLVVRRFAAAPRFVLTLATIGVAQVIGAVDLLLPELFGDNRFALAGGLRPPLSVRIQVAPVLFNGAHVTAVAAVPLAMAALAWFLLGTGAGRAVRGAADNHERARLMGIPVWLLSTLVWSTAGVLAALAAVLALPLQGQARGVSGDPSVLLPALAAAVLAGMTSLPRAAVAGIALGVAQQSIFWATSRGGLIDVGYLVVILAALLLGRQRRSARAEAGSAWTWPGVGDAAPLPAAVARRPCVRLARGGLIAAVAVAAGAAPFVADTRQLNLLGSVTAVYALVAVSLVVLTGWAGQISLGQFAVAGVGAVVAANLLARAGADLFVALLAASAAGAGTAVVLGLPALRARGLFFPVTTLAFAAAMASYFLNPTYFSGLLPEVIHRPLLFGHIDLADERNLYWFCAAVVAAALAGTLGVRASRAGRVLIAVRDNPWAAQARGVSLLRARLMAFAVSGALAGLAGGLHVVVLDGVRIGTYSPLLSFEAFAMVVIGGLTSVWGALAGAIALRWAEYVAEGALRLFVTGAGVLALLLVLPGGLAGLARRLRAPAVRLLAGRDREPTSGPEATDPTESVSGADPRPAPAPPESVTGGGPLRPPVTPPAPAGPGRSPQPGSRLSGAAPGARLVCEAVHVGYGPLPVLFGVDFSVEPGEVVALLGTNGAGKSTLLRAISGLTPPQQGRILLDGADITGLAPEAIARRGVVQMPGGRGIFPSLSVADNLRLAAWIFRRDGSAVDEALDRVLGLFPVLRLRLREPAGLLSGGQQQMLTLAQALVPRPRLLMIDELSLGLAPAVVGELLDVVRALDGPSIVLVEQSVNVALALAERAVFLEKGTVRFTGPVEDLLHRSDLVRAVFLGGDDADTPVRRPRNEAPTDGHALSGDWWSGVDRALPPPPAGHDNGQRHPRPASPDPVLRAESVTVHFVGLTALDGATLDVHDGEILGVIGPNGAGKTTLFDVLSGFVRPDTGRVEYDGHDVTRAAPHLRALAGLCRSFQDTRLFPGLTVADNVAVACEGLVTSFGPLAPALRLPGAAASERAVLQRTDELLLALGLAEWRDRFPGDLSTGMRRLLELGCLLAQQPRVLLLDEPSAGLAQAEAEALGPLLRRVRDASGCAVVIVAHDVPLLLAACDRLAAMDLGRIIAAGPPGDVVRHPHVIASYLGQQAPSLVATPAP
jgi:ABC-type branched-subunit amino acid transport system ATPase component/ABC-type branched-subunit amino acid transport system permease subunit